MVLYGFSFSHGRTRRFLELSTGIAFRFSGDFGCGSNIYVFFEVELYSRISFMVRPGYLFSNDLVVLRPSHGRCIAGRFVVVELCHGFYK